MYPDCGIYLDPRSTGWGIFCWETSSFYKR